MLGIPGCHALSLLLSLSPDMRVVDTPQQHCPRGFPQDVLSLCTCWERLPGIILFMEDTIGDGDRQVTNGMEGEQLKQLTRAKHCARQSRSQKPQFAGMDNNFFLCARVTDFCFTSSQCITSCCLVCQFLGHCDWTVAICVFQPFKRKIVQLIFAMTCALFVCD